MQLRQYVIRNMDAPELVELFLIASVASVLAIRLFLAATGYPQIGGDGLHIAHMLWGGLFMAIALFLQFSLLGPTIQRFAAILAGIGFGTFVDELGKFITNDNDYFFQPTIGLIYIIFIAIFLFARSLRRRNDMTPDEAIANALYRLQEAVNGRVNDVHKHKILGLLREVRSSSVLASDLYNYAEQIDTKRFSDFSFYFRWRDYALNLYKRVVLNIWFTRAVVAFFVFVGVVQIIVVVALIIESQVVGRTESATFADGAEAVSSTAGALFILVGVVKLRRSRIDAYRWFLRAMLISIFITQVFVFFEDQLAATVGLFIDILLYLALRFIIEGEESQGLGTVVDNPDGVRIETA